MKTINQIIRAKNQIDKARIQLSKISNSFKDHKDIHLELTRIHKDLDLKLNELDLIISSINHLKK